MIEEKDIQILRSSNLNEVSVIYPGGCVRITYWDNNNISLIKYFDAGRNLHRENGPAKISRFNNGKYSSVVYRRHGSMHREDGPARIKWDSRGNRFLEEYKVNGKYHREDGPAKILRTEENEGSILPLPLCDSLKVAYYLDGEIYYKEKDYYREVTKRKVNRNV